MSVVPFNTQEILQDIVRLDTSSIEELVDNLDAILKKRKKDVEEQKEQELIGKVYQVTTSDSYKQYQLLTEKLRSNEITEEEHQELLSLTPKIEANNVERLEHLMTLARLRKTSLREVMRQLGLAF